MTCSRCGGACADGRARVRWPVVLGVYGLGLVLSWTLFGSVFHDLVEGVDRSHLPWWKALVALGVLWLGGALHLARLQRRVCTACNLVEPAWLLRPLPVAAESGGPTRRRVLRIAGASATALAATGAGVATAVRRNNGWRPVFNDFFRTRVETLSPDPKPEWQGSVVKSYRRLGRTNVLVSDISLGGGGIHDADVARAALDRGITYFDTSPDYSDTRSERVLGEAMKGRRDQVFLATKFCVSSGHLPNDTPVPKIIEAVDGSLKRLQTDHVDLIHIHSCDRVDRLMAPNIHTAFDRLKEQGKVRFLGVSTHTPNLEVVANAAIDSGRFDVMMLAYHFGMWPSFGHILEKAKAHDVAVVAMKTLKGAKHTNLAEFRDEASAYSQAAFRWVLSNPAVACLVISISTHRHLDEYLYASGTTPHSSDVALLERYDRLIAGDYCQPHCGHCLDSCLYELPINDILRYRMYAKDYGWEKDAIRLYAKLQQNASACIDCTAPCANTCPIGVPIQEKLLETHRLLA